MDWSLNSYSLAENTKRVAEVLKKKWLESSSIKQGKILEINSNEVFVDIGYKSYFSADELKSYPNLKVGDTINVYVRLHILGRKRAPLSYKEAFGIAEVIKTRERIIEAYETQEIISGKIRTRKKDGFIVDIFGREAFLHNSQIDIQKANNLLVETIMDFKIILINCGWSNDIFVSNKVVSMVEYNEFHIKDVRDLSKRIEKNQIDSFNYRSNDTYSESDYECPACGARGQANCCNYSIDQL